MKEIVMLLTNAFDPDVRVYKEAKYLISKGFSVTILCWDRAPQKNLPADEVMEGIHVVRFPLSSVPGTGIKQLPVFFKYIQKCRAYLKKHTCAYLHCNDLDGAVTGYLAHAGKTKMVFDMHEFYEIGSDFKKKIIRRVTLFLLKRSKAGLYENNIYLNPNYASVRSKLVPLRNYPDSDFVQVLPKTESDVFRIGYHGAVRGQIPEFKALFEAVKDMSDVRVDINGGGIDLDDLKELEKQYTNVYVHGYYDGTKETARLYSETDVLFCGYDPTVPNYQGDSEAVKFYEAIFTGTPMIMTQDIGMGEKVEKNGYGIACDTRDPAAIRDAIMRMKTNHDLWQQYSASELKDADHYDWKNAVKVLDSIYV